MSFNSSAVRAIRSAKMSQHRMRRPSNFQKTVFLAPSDLEGADQTPTVYQIRLWPGDPQKNPFGYLNYITHTAWLPETDPLTGIVNKFAKRFDFVCPRTTNWDPIPLNHEEVTEANARRQAYEKTLAPMPATGATKEQFDGRRDAMKLYDATYPSPEVEWREPCLACDLEAAITDQGYTAELIDDPDVNRWLFGEGNRSPGLFASGKYNFPATIWATVGEKIPWKNEVTGKEGFNVEYRPCDKPLHCILQFDPGRLVEKLVDYILEVPECSDLRMGRMFRLSKKHGGKGVGGYELDIAPRMSEAGFVIPDGAYMNFSAWGKGSKEKPGKRFRYDEIEAIVLNPQHWVYGALLEMEVIDGEDSGASAAWEGSVPF